MLKPVAEINIICDHFCRFLCCCWILWLLWWWYLPRTSSRLFLWWILLQLWWLLQWCHWHLLYRYLNSSCQFHQWCMLDLSLKPSLASLQWVEFGHDKLLVTVKSIRRHVKIEFGSILYVMISVNAKCNTRPCFILWTDLKSGPCGLCIILLL